jgi:hypothetical protein
MKVPRNDVGAHEIPRHEIADAFPLKADGLQVESVVEAVHTISSATATGGTVSRRGEFVAAKQPVVVDYELRCACRRTVTVQVPSRGFSPWFRCTECGASQRVSLRSR